MTVLLPPPVLLDVRAIPDRPVLASAATGPAVATHRRTYGRGERVLDPLHFLVTLGQKPATLDHAPAYRDWALPPAFATLRADLERRRGPRPGARPYIAVLQLLARCALDRTARAVAHHLAPGGPTAAAITATAERLDDPDPPPGDTRLSHVAVPAPTPPGRDDPGRAGGRGRRHPRRRAPPAPPPGPLPAAPPRRIRREC